MTDSQTLACTCGEVKLRLAGPPIASVECLCTSCRTAGQILETLPGSPRIVDDKGATALVMKRKDRVEILSGARHLRQFRLSPDAATRRVVASCCNTPVFLEFNGGHWLSIYAGLWPQAARPPIELRTMTGDLEDSSTLPGDVPNLKRHSLQFYALLLSAWVRMGFKNPKFAVEGELNV
ncbi:hypothetical protein SAMN05877838_0356 [Hoeflea halophila]|uniref:CENP-V/GFA domain-containing protein n=1 Tax=Hoeflea halophila TaxID=714899 RepID=A0A286HMW4_9HYPH|nr:DUF6151 family protein [Hoeflea halophila]SOE08629.1 hypothetical protein SAMN05877838_0356 [Hoeflea halophila]